MQDEIKLHIAFVAANRPVAAAAQKRAREFGAGSPATRGGGTFDQENAAAWCWLFQVCQWQPHGATKNHGLRTSNQGHGNGRSGHGSAAAAPGRLSVSVFSPYRFPSSSGPTQGSCQQHHPPPTRQQQGTTTAPSNPGACVGDLKPPQPLPHTHTSSAQHEVPSPQADSLPRPPTPRCSCRSPCRSSSRASS